LCFEVKNIFFGHFDYFLEHSMMVREPNGHLLT